MLSQFKSVGSRWCIAWLAIIVMFFAAENGLIMVRAHSRLLSGQFGPRRSVAETQTHSRPVQKAIPPRSPSLAPPRQSGPDDLVVSWTNVLKGSGSARMYRSPTDQTWVSDCADGLRFEYKPSTTPELAVTFWISGGCGGQGESHRCSNLSAPPFALRAVDPRDSPLRLTCAIDCKDCPGLASAGYTQFNVNRATNAEGDQER